MQPPDIPPLTDVVLRLAGVLEQLGCPMPWRLFHGRDVRVTTAEDLILLKMAFHRHKDLQDIKGILHVQQGRLDIPYLRHWSGQMLEEPAGRELDELIATYEADRPA